MATRQNNPRADKGRVILTARDWSGLRFVAEMYAVRLDSLAQWFAPHCQPPLLEQSNAPNATEERQPRRQWPSDPKKRLNNTYDIVRRWQQVGLAQLEKPFSDAPMWCWITKRGLEELGLPYTIGSGFPFLNTLPHFHEVNHVRLTLAWASQNGKQIKPHTWISERTLASSPDQFYGIPTEHRPDGILQFSDGSQEAIEVELTQKSHERLYAILSDLTSHYTHIRYFATESITSTLLEARAQLNTDQQTQILIYRL